MAKKERRSHCPISYGLDVFGDRWTLLILRDVLFKSKKYYGEFLASEEKIATNILADRLQKLEQEEVLTKQVDPNNASKFVYALSQKGLDLAPLLVELILWSARYDPETAAEPGFVESALRDKASLIASIANVKK